MAIQYRTTTTPENKQGKALTYARLCENCGRLHPHRLIDPDSGEIWRRCAYRAGLLQQGVNHDRR